MLLNYKFYIYHRNKHLIIHMLCKFSSYSLGCLFTFSKALFASQKECSLMNLTCSLSWNHLTWPFIILFVLGALDLPGLLDFDPSGVQTQVWCSCVPSRVKHSGHPVCALVQLMPRFYLPGRDLWTRSLRSSTSEILGMTSSPPFDSSSSIAEESSEGCPGKTQKSI